MKSIRTVAVFAALMIGGLSFAADPPAAPANPNDELIKRLGGQGEPAAKTAEEFEAAYTKVLPQLLAKPEKDDTALQRISFRASRPGADVERMALAKVLANKLTAADATPAVKVVALRHLERIGREEVVPALMSELASDDKQIAECARRALANNPTKAAADGLRAAIDTAQDPAWKGALVNALVHRRDPGDTGLLAKLTADGDDAVRVPAEMALARVGDASATAVLFAARSAGSDGSRAAATDALLLLADRLATGGHSDEAMRIYRDMFPAGGPARYAIIAGLRKIGGTENIEKLLDLLSDRDVQARGAALNALSAFPAAQLNPEVTRRLAHADVSTKPWLLRALLIGKDKGTLPIFREAAGDPEEAVRLAAIGAITEIGDASMVDVLLKSAAAKGEEQVAARNALEVLPGRPVDAALLERLSTGPVPQRLEVIRAFGARRTTAALVPLFDAATDKDASVRGEALKSIALIGEFNSLPQALELLVNAKEDGDRDQASKTVVALARKKENQNDRVGPILAELDKEQSTPVRSALLAALGQLGGDKSLAAVRDAIKSEDEKIHEAGVRALASWPDVAPLNDLLALAKEEKSNTLSVLSLRGYVRLVGLPSKRPAAETVKLYQDAMAAAKRPDEKKMVLGGLGEIKDAKALEVVAPFLSEESLMNEACAASVKIARESWEANKGLAKLTMMKVVQVSKNDGQKKTAKEVLDKIAQKEKEQEKKEQEKQEKEKKEQEKKPV
jgi:HEAT repeat protein